MKFFDHPPLDTLFPDRFPGRIAREALLAGQSVPDLSEPFVYCDLACQNGETLLLLAASYPKATFYGSGMSESEATRAAERATALGLTNLKLLDLSDADAPPCDFVCCRNPSGDDDDDLTAAVKLLKPGGLLQIPVTLESGEGTTNLLKSLLSTATEHGDGEWGPALERVARLARADAPLQRDNPLLETVLKDWEARSLSDVIGKLFDFPFTNKVSEILEWASDLGLGCCGPLESLTPMGKAIAHHFAPDLKDSSDLSATGIIEDYFSILKGEKSRSMVFIKPESDFSRAPMSLLGAHVIGFAEPMLWSEAVDTPATPLGEWTASQDHEPLTLGTVMAQVATEAVRGDDIETVGKMIGQALNERKAQLYATDTRDITVSPDTSIEAAHALTTQILETPRTYRFGAHLPSPVLGGGVFLKPTYAALLRATLDGNPDRTAHAVKLIDEMESQAPPFALSPTDRALPDPSEDLSDFDANWLPFLARIGVIQARPA